MKKVLALSGLFDGISDEGYSSLLSCLSAGQKSFHKGDFIYRAGDRPSSMGIVLSGEVHIISEDYWGNRTILGLADVGAVFAEAFVCAGVPQIPVSVVADQDCEILFIDGGKVISSCPSVCAHHALFARNMMRVLARKNVMLTQKIGHLSKRTTREKLLSYLSEQAKKAGGNEFEIAFDRQELAEYLSVDRSAMSAELSKMQNEGLLRVKKNHFVLLAGVQL